MNIMVKRKKYLGDNMNKVYIFDVDGTLTPSRIKMKKEFKEFFLKWAKGKKYYLVSGSNIEKMDEQVPEEIMMNAQGVFCCGGNELWEFDPHIVNFPYNRIYNRKFTPPIQLMTYLGELIRFSETPVQSTKHRENRGSMLNFSVVGRDCTIEERKKYFEWDNQVEERKTIAEYIERQWPELEAVIGGQISIDIAPKGRNKSQVLKHIQERENADKYIFLGDRIEEGGNDYPLARLMGKTTGCNYYKVSGYKETQEILENLID